MVTVDSKGRIVLPSTVRDELGLRPGSEVVVNVESNRVVVEPEDDPEEIVDRLEGLIEEAATNRARRREREPEGTGLALDDDSIAAKQHEIIQRGGAQSGSDDHGDEQ